MVSFSLLIRYLTRRSNYVATVSSRGLDVELALTPHPRDESGTIFIAVLDCDMGRDEVSHELTPAIILQKTQWHNDTEFVRVRPDHLLMLSMNRMKLAKDLNRYRLGYDRLSEAQPRQIFVPNNLSTRLSPRGVLFHPEVEPLHHDKPFMIDVLSNNSAWFFYVSKSTLANPVTGSLHRRNSAFEEPPHEAGETFVLNFDHTSDLGATEPAQPIVLGFLELEIKQNGGWNSWRTCLVIGLEPHPPNPFGTPSLYTVPWYAFEKKDKVAAGELGDVLARENRAMEHKLLHEVLQVEFDLESRHSRLFYNVILKLKESSKDSRR